jgi:hypothetical protein
MRSWTYDTYIIKDEYGEPFLDDLGLPMAFTTRGQAEDYADMERMPNNTKVIFVEVKEDA